MYALCDKCYLQTVVLLSLRQSSSETPLSLDEIKFLSGINDVRLLKRVLHSLSCQNSQIRLVSKNPSDNMKTVFDTDKFYLISHFKHKQKKVSNIYVYFYNSILCMYASAN
jgi:hypothetical protein